MQDVIESIINELALWCEVANATKADQRNLTSRRTFWNIPPCVKKRPSHSPICLMKGAFVQEHLNSTTILDRTLRSTIDYNNVLKVDSYYLSIVDEESALSERRLFASIRENGSLELSHKPNGNFEGIKSRTPQDCANVSGLLTRLAFDELKSANKTFHQIQLIRQKIQVIAKAQSSAIVKLIDELIQIHFKLEMLRWDREVLFVTDKKEFIGFSGTHYKVPHDDRNRSALFASIMDRERRLKHGEKWVVRKMFGRTLKVYVWNVSFKRAYLKKPSFSNILRGLNLLSEEEGDIEGQLYLINRYLPKDFLSGSHPPLKNTTFELQDRAVLLKLKELIIRRNHSYFVRKLSCLEDMIRNLSITAN
nr:hypothetical protein HmN_000782200 [Hymenolepis microstoma]